MDNKDLEENKLKVLTLNCQGLNDFNKRKDVFKNLRMKNYNIYFLQDTHFNEKEEILIQSQWGSKAFFNSYKTNSRGVAILLNNNFEYKVHNVHKDNSGNYLILDTTIANMNPLLVNIYGHNLDATKFYSEIIGKIDSCLNTQHIIMGVILI